jgi:hypothetical protein
MGLLYLNFLEPFGPLQACNGTALPFFLVLRLIFSKNLSLSCACYMSNPLHLLLSSPEKYLVKNVNFEVTHLRIFLRLTLMFPGKFLVGRVLWDFMGQKSRNLVMFKDSSIARYDAVSLRK